ncbi:MAG: hypothetical protein ACTHJO_14145 [Rhodanobacter sp.]
MKLSTTREDMNGRAASVFAPVRSRAGRLIFLPLGSSIELAKTRGIGSQGAAVWRPSRPEDCRRAMPAQSTLHAVAVAQQDGPQIGKQAVPAFPRDLPPRRRASAGAAQHVSSQQALYKPA